MSTKLLKVSAPVHAIDVAKCFVEIANTQVISVPETGDKLTEGITHLKLQKLLYFAQAAHLAVHDTPLFTDEIQAWEFGPVIPTVYSVFAKYASAAIPSDEGVCPSDPSVKLFLEEVWKVFGKYSASELVNLSHNIGPWSLIYEKNKRGAVIPEEAIKVAFKKVFVNNDERNPATTQATAS